MRNDFFKIFLKEKKHHDRQFITTRAAAVSHMSYVVFFEDVYCSKNVGKQEEMKGGEVLRVEHTQGVKAGLHDCFHVSPLGF